MSCNTLLIRLWTQVPNHRATIDGLYRLLKPGGRFIVCEHVLQPYPNGGDLIAALLQKLYMIVGWSFWVGGCSLDRDTDAALRDVAGSSGWEEVKATYLSPYSTVPYLVGEYVKSKWEEPRRVVSSFHLLHYTWLWGLCTAKIEWYGQNWATLASLDTTHQHAVPVRESRLKYWLAQVFLVYFVKT
jgi:hypothetical protein